MGLPKPVVLFVDRSNSTRSQMAEALLRSFVGERFVACSAGLEPEAVHPLTRWVLEEIDLDCGEMESKNVRRFLGRVPVSYVVFLGEPAEPGSPRVFPFAKNSLHWPIEDPALAPGSQMERLQKFRDVRDYLAARISNWAAAAVGSA